MLYIQSNASLSLCEAFRYRLERIWGQNSECILTFVMLNPSTADAERDDPTIRRCVAFAKREGYHGITIINLFSLRTKDPKVLKHGHTKNGIMQSHYVSTAMRRAYDRGLGVVCAWGVHGGLQDADKQFVAYAKLIGVPLTCLGETKNGHPKHPLYLHRDTEFKPYEGRK